VDSLRSRLVGSEVNSIFDASSFNFQLDHSMVKKVVCLISLVALSTLLIGCGGSGENVQIQASQEEMQAHEAARAEAQKIMDESVTPGGDA